MQQFVTPDDFTPHTNHYKTIFLSDIHLGSRACQADLLLDFLKYNECEKMYLVGDIVDGWRLKRSWYWPQSHNDVVQKILRKARKGTQVVYVPGNHDEGLRRYCGTHFGGIEVCLTDTYKAGKRQKLSHYAWRRVRQCCALRPLAGLYWRPRL